MAGKKKQAAKPAKRQVEEEYEYEGRFARIGEMVTALLGSVGERTRVAQRVVAGLVIVALGVGWIIGLSPLKARVAAAQSDPMEITFRWPTTRSSRQTWVPPAVRADLTQIVMASVGMDPFDIGSLERANALLMNTGWFVDVDGVRREAGGIVEVGGDWRTPAAVVTREGREYLIGVDTAVMRLPPDTEAPREMFRIIAPLADAPRDSNTGRVLYGHQWHFDDVKHAIELLEMIARLPEADSIVGIDLSEYPRQGHISLVTDTGCALVWGSPIGEPAPVEVADERKMAHVRAILDPARRLDRGQRRIELFTEQVITDWTPPSDPSG